MEKQVSFADGQINYVIKGRGEAVILLHGFLENHSIWNEFAEELSSNYQVIAIDLPGFGKSTASGRVNSMSFMAEAVNAVLEQELVEKCILVGHSMGGYVTLAFARKFQDKLAGIVLFHSQAASDDEQGKINRDRTVKIVKSDHGSFIHEFVPTLFCEEMVSQYSDQIEVLKAHSLNTPVTAITAALEGMRDREDSLNLLAELTIPVFFIVGKKDSKIPLNKIMEQISIPANSEALIVDNVGHMGFIEAKTLTFQALQHFIERNI